MFLVLLKCTIVVFAGTYHSAPRILITPYKDGEKLKLKWKPENFLVEFKWNDVQHCYNRKYKTINTGKNLTHICTLTPSCESENAYYHIDKKRNKFWRCGNAESKNK